MYTCSAIWQWRTEEKHSKHGLWVLFLAFIFNEPVSELYLQSDIGDVFGLNLQSAEEP